MDDKPYVSKHPGKLVLNNESHFLYYANCYVNMADGTITFGDSLLPS